MPRQIAPLTDTAIRKAKPASKPLKLGDGFGLYLLVMPTGGRWWRLDYRFNGKRQTVSLGVYPEVSLKLARERRESARRQVAEGIDPGFIRKHVKQSLTGEADNSFEMVAREWYVKHAPIWAASNSDKVIQRFERDVFPWIGRRVINQITAPELLSVLRRIEDRGAGDTAHRARQTCGQVFRYAIATGRAERDIAADLRGALVPVKGKHFPSITDPKGVGALMRAIDAYAGHVPTRCALRLAPLVFVRPGELLQAEWSEVDLDKAEWRLPAHKMKMSKPHIVPLSRQAVEIIREVQPLTGNGKYLFPSVRTDSRPMSNATLIAALRRLGYTTDQMTPHGFRSMASTLLNEQGWNRDWIERQLAHGERDGVRAAYNYAEHVPERRKMMQAWADYLDKAARGDEVPALSRTA
jgi:integrase